MISGQVIGTDIDDNGNIRVKTEYTLTDGSKQIGHTRYNFLNYSQGKVLEDIKSQCENLMRKIYNLKANQELIKTPVSASYDCSSIEITVKPPVYSTDGKTIITPEEKMIIDDK